ncbi:MAG TPA: universal stress protein [Candidatus Polarisedimenticolia bacterium]|jgi:nucleotide-binding universal stress UspA family protein|nr:universal stress protein [Candidatus Polarisedimenticolia bacterium]
MYQRIYVPVDNSEHSDRAIECGVELGRAFGASLTGSHVYAASMHDYRFRQMEYTLPEEYIEEVELERQRKIHDSLITMGLRLISDSYLDQMSKKCAGAGLGFTPRMMDGKHHVEILKDIKGSEYDLVVLGALGLGRVRDSVLGSVCERVARASDRDVWVVKRVPENGSVAAQETVLVGIDGSPQSFGALMTGLELAQKLGKKLEIIAVYDPYLHYKVFNGIVGVLTEKAAKVFRFEEQNQLHEEIIDTGLATIYQSHLEVAETMAREAGVEVKKTLLDGKAYQKILDHVRKTDPYVLVLGRIGIHSDPEETGLGSNTENLLRLAPCDVLLTTRKEIPRLDVKAEESVRWTPEAENRMKRVPEQVRGVARMGVLRIALEKGHSVVTNAVIDEAMDRFMPKDTSLATQALAEAVALERARTQSVSMCKGCGVSATEAAPAKCTVCGGLEFEVISPEMVERIAAVEGGLSEEVTYDGRKLRWSEDAKRALWSVKDAYQRRRTKARVEKGARMRKLDVVTLEFTKALIEEETGVPLVVPAKLPPEAAKETDHAALPEAIAAALAGNGPGNGRTALPEEKKIVARDGNKNPLVSVYAWTPEALERVFRVPAGFMRNMTQERIEGLAKERGVATIDLAVVEGGIEIGKQMMAEMISTYQRPGATPNAAKADPVSVGQGSESTPTAPMSPSSQAGARGYLNEVRTLSASSPNGNGDKS